MELSGITERTSRANSSANVANFKRTSEANRTRHIY